MITFYIWIQLSLVCLLGAMSPGPSVALIIYNTINKNRLNGIITSIGHGLGVSLYALLAVLGLGILIENYFNIFIGFQITGSFFLIAIGLHAIFSANNNKTNEINGEKVDPLIGWCLTSLVNFTGHPAASIPAGFSKEGHPIGMQIIGRRYSDMDVIAASSVFESLHPWYKSYKQCADRPI